MALWRHGDILIQSIDTIPEHVVKVGHPVLATGEATGHRHRIKNGKSVCIYRDKYFLGLMFMEVIHEFADLVHPEHDKIRLPRGKYRIWHQREYTDYGIRPIGD